MDESTASRTALSTALMRAAHTRLDPNPLIQDSWGDRLVPESARENLRARALAQMDEAAKIGALASPGSIVDDYLLRSRAYQNVVMRTRYTEDALQAAVVHGIRQYVLIGAGFDSFALRQPAFAEHLRVFEIDHPATQALKLQRIEVLGISPADTVHFIAADLSQETLQAALARSSFRRDEPTFFSWLGVTMYLSHEANLAILRAIASCAPPGSELVFTYMDERAFETQTESLVAMLKALAELGEPFLSGFDPHRLDRDLSRCGLSVVEDLSADQLAARYGRSVARRPGQASFSHIARARVAAHTNNV